MGPDPMNILRNWLLGTIAVILLGFALQIMKPVLVPVLLALFIALVVSPVERRIAMLVPRHIRWPGILAAVAVILSSFALFLTVFWVGARRIAGALVGLPQRIDDLVAQSELEEWTVFGADISQLVSLLGDRGAEFMTGLTTRTINSVSTTVITLALTLFLVFLMLADAPRWLKTLESNATPEETSRWRAALRLIARKLRIYLLARAGLGLITALLYVGWLWYGGVELLSVWFMLTLILSFVPNLGSVLSAVLPILYASLTGAELPIWAIAVGLLVIEQGVGNLLDPQVQGKQLSLSPVVVLLSVIFWGWLWGPAGAILGVPIMVAVVVGAAHLEATRPVALILSDQTDMEGLDRVALDRDIAA